MNIINLNLIDVIKLLIAFVLSALIGFERQLRKEPAGLRTHMLVCIGATLLTIVSINFQQDPARIIAGIVTGIGFIGAGTIIARQFKVIGLTTAASLWFVAALGITIGVGLYWLAVIATIVVLIILNLWKVEKKLGLK